MEKPLEITGKIIYSINGYKWGMSHCHVWLLELMFESIVEKKNKRHLQEKIQQETVWLPRNWPWKGETSPISGQGQNVPFQTLQFIQM